MARYLKTGATSEAKATAERKVRDIVEAAVAAGLSISDKARTTGDEAQTTEETK